MTKRSCTEYPEETARVKIRKRASNKGQKAIACLVAQSMLENLLSDPGVLAQTCKYFSTHVSNRLRNVFAWAPHKYLISLGVDKNLIAVYRSVYQSHPSTYILQFACNHAIFNGHTSIAEHLVESRYYSLICRCELAAGYNRLDMLKLFADCRCSMNGVCSIACRQGNLDIVKYYVEKGGRVKIDNFAQAAFKGHFAIVQYFHEIDLPWDETVTLAAAKGGHLDILKYAYENGCPIDLDICFMKYFTQNIDMRKYLLALSNGTKELEWNDTTD